MSWWHRSESRGTASQRSIGRGTQPRRNVAERLCGTRRLSLEPLEGRLLLSVAAPLANPAALVATPLATTDTSTILNVSLTDSMFGQPVTLTATVPQPPTPVVVAAPGEASPADLSGPSGTVTFKDGTTTLGTAMLSGISATFTTKDLVIGQHSLTAVYNGDSNYNTSTSVAVAETVNRSSTTTTLTASQNPSVVGSAVTLTANVATPYNSSTRPTGTFIFMDGATTLATVTVAIGGTVSLRTSRLTVGVHSLSVVYNGDGRYLTSTSSSLSQTVSNAKVTLTSSANTLNVGDAEKFTAVVSDVTGSTGLPTGSVTFLDGTSALGTATLENATATFTTSTLSGVVHTITARYNGDSNYLASASTTTVTVTPAPTAATLGVSPNPAIAGHALTLTMTVQGATFPGIAAPSGDVAFYEGWNYLGHSALVGNTATLSVSSLPAGTYSDIAAYYGGDAYYATSSATAPTLFVTAAVPTITRLINAPAVSPLGQTVTMAATVETEYFGPSLENGTVAFLDGVIALGTSTVRDGVATFSAATLAPGVHNITCVYSGDDTYLTSTSPARELVVGPALTTTALTASATSIAYGQPLTLHASVTSQMPGNSPTGTVDFFDTTVGVDLGTAPLCNDVADLSVATLAGGNHAIVANYLGNTMFAASSTTVGPESIINTIVGNGSNGYTGDGGPATAAALAWPRSVAVDGTGKLVIADTWNHVIRRVDLRSGLITTVAGSGQDGNSGDGGQATKAALGLPAQVVEDSLGDLFIVDLGTNVVREVDAQTNLIDTIVGGPASAAQLNWPQGIAIDADGNLYIADTWNNVIREVSHATGLISTIAGTGLPGYSGDGGPASAAQLQQPIGIAVDSAGNVFFADNSNNVIREVFRKSGLIETIAGKGTKGWSGDGGPAVNAELNDPLGLALDGAGNLLIADCDNNLLREVNLRAGTISTLASDISRDFRGDSTPTALADLYHPWGLAVDSAGNVFVADMENSRIREINANSKLSITIAPLASTTAVATSIDGQTLTISATVSAAVGSGTPSGTVDFYDNTTAVDLGQAVLVGGRASLSTTKLAAGSHCIKASYSGDGNFAASQSSMTVTPALPSICILNTTAAGAVNVSGNATINVPGPLLAASRSSMAVFAIGAGRIQASCIDVVGGCYSAGKATIGVTPVKVAAVNDPLASLPIPTTATTRGAVAISGRTKLTINPGVYSSISAAGNAQLILQPGVYVVTGRFYVTGSAHVTGNGVLIYLAGQTSRTWGLNQQLMIEGNAALNLTAAATGPYAGVSIFQARDNGASISIGGQAVVTLAGALYAPAAAVSLAGKAQLSAPLVANRLTMAGSASLRVGSSSTGGTKPTSPIIILPVIRPRLTAR
jgi:sugar lactone lactonase YvrE